MSGTSGGTGDKLAATDPKSVVRHHGGPVVGDGSANDTTFYITLTIEQDDDDDDPLERIDNSGKNEMLNDTIIVIKYTTVCQKC